MQRPAKPKDLLCFLCDGNYFFHSAIDLGDQLVIGLSDHFKDKEQWIDSLTGPDIIGIIVCTILLVLVFERPLLNLLGWTEIKMLNIFCLWVFFRFSLLSLESDHSCRYDYVEVRDGDDLDSPVIGRFCGDQLPRPVKSSGNHLHILFTSDGYNNLDGFVITFQERSGRYIHC